MTNLERLLGIDRAQLCTATRYKLRVDDVREAGTRVSAVVDR